MHLDLIHNVLLRFIVTKHREIKKTRTKRQLIYLHFYCICWPYVVKGVWKEINGFLTLNVFFMPCGCCCSVSLSHGAVDLSVVCDSDISWSYLPFGVVVGPDLIL